MAIERTWKQISAVSFTADGQSNGIITIADTFCFKVNMVVILKAAGKEPLRLGIKRVIDDKMFIVGPEKGTVHSKYDVSSYVLGINPTVESPEQPRPNIPPADYERAVYEEEPTVAKRVFNVDKYGRPYTDNNPFPTIDSAKDFEPTHFEDNVVTAGVPDNITLPGKDIQLAFIFNPNKGPSKNGSQDVLFITIDGSVKKTTIPRGASRYFPGTFNTLEVDTNNSGTNYEIIVWSEV